MNRRVDHPPRWAERLIRAVTPREDEEYLVADLAERYEQVAAANGRTVARRWYRRQALRSVLAVPSFASVEVVDGAVGDAKIAMRLLRRRPIYTLGVVGTMAIGISSLVSVGSIAWAVWLSPFPFPDPDRVVRLYEVDRRALVESADDDAGRSRISPPLLEDLRAHDWESVRAVAGVSANVYDWLRDGGTTRIQSVTASPELFDILGMRLVAGRAVSDDPDVAEVVLTEAFWDRSWGSDLAVVGRDDMVLNGEPHRIVGVVQPVGPFPREADVYTSIRWDADQLGPGMRGARYLDVIARVEPGADADIASAEMDRIVEELGRSYPNHEGWGGGAVVLSDDLLEPYRGVLALLLVAGALFLALAVANVVGLVAARGVEDRPARAVRLALGSSEGRLLRASALEGVLVGALAGALAIVVSAGSFGPVRALVPVGTPRADAIGLSGVAVVTALGLAVVGGLFVGLVAHGLTRPGGSGSALRAGRAVIGTRGRSAAVVGQFTLATLLGIGGAVVLAEIASMRAVDLGFDPTGTSAVQVVLSGQRHPTPESRRAFWGDLLTRSEARGIPLSIVTNAPMSGMSMPWGLYREGDPDQHFAQYHIVSHGYFGALGIDLIEGRGFTPDDRAGGEQVIVVSRRLASELFPGASAVGQSLTVVGVSKRIVGVVESARHFGPDQDEPPELYAPFPQDPWPHAQVLVGGSPADAGAFVEGLLADIDPALEVPALVEYEQYVERWYQSLRLQSIVIGLLAVVGTLLTALGLYAVVAYRVAARARETGIRMALGASGRRVFSRVVRDGAGLAALGTSIGCAAWFAVGPALARWVGAFDGAPGWVVPSVAVVILAVAGAASIGPAARSVALDPATALGRERG